MSTSQTLNTVLRDLQKRDWEERLKILEESGRVNGTASSIRRIRAPIRKQSEGFIRQDQKRSQEAGVAKTGQRRENSTALGQLRNAMLRTSSRRGSWVQIPPPAPIQDPESIYP